MLQNRQWTDPTAEAEFWKQMERLEGLAARLSALDGISGLLRGGPFRRAALQRDLDGIRRLAQALVDQHTVSVATAAPAAAMPVPTPAMGADDPLRTLAGMVVSLRQDRAARPEAGEETAV